MNMATATTPRPSSKGSGSSTITSSSSSDKNSSKINAAITSSSPKRLPTLVKNSTKDTISRSTSLNVSKSVSSSTPPSSSSDSTQPSPSYKENTTIRSVKDSPKKDASSSSPSKCSSSKKTKRSPVTSCSSPLKRSISTHSNSPSLSHKGTPPTSTNVSPSKKGVSPLSSPLRGEPEEVRQGKGHQSTNSSVSGWTDSPTNTSPHSKLVTKLDKIKEDEDDEIIAVEILKELDVDELENSPNCTHEKSRSSNISSSKPQSLEEETDFRVPSIDDLSVVENEPHNTQNVEEPAEEPYFEKISEKSLNYLYSLLEGHEIRKKKISDLKIKLTKSDSPKAEASKSVSNNPKKHSLSKSKSCSTESSHSNSPTGKSPRKTVVKGSPLKRYQKPKRTESKVGKDLKSPSRKTLSEDGENIKDIDKMIGLLEGHVARKAFLTMHSHNSLEDSQKVT